MRDLYTIIVEGSRDESPLRNRVYPSVDEMGKGKPSWSSTLFLRKNFPSLKQFPCTVCSASDETVSCMLSKRWNRFALAQHSFGCPCIKLSKFERWLGMRKNLFGVHSVCNESFLCMLTKQLSHFPVCSASACYNFQKVPKKAKLKMQFSTINKWNFEKSPRIPSNRTTVTKKILQIPRNIKLVLHMLSHRKMFKHRNSGKNLKKKIIIFSNIY
jgi:hypothetical protein